MPGKRPPMTDEQRQEISARMKRFHAGRKAKAKRGARGHPVARRAVVDLDELTTETGAIRTVLEALAPLHPESRDSVLSYVNSRLA